MGDKAWFKATREMCGLSQQDVADDLIVNLLSVKRWEREDLPNYPVPEFALEYMDNQLGMFYNALDASLEAVSDIRYATEEANEGAELAEVQFSYFRDQKMYDLLGRDKGRVGQVNAISRATAVVLSRDGIDVDWAYPTDEDKIPTP